MEQMKTNAIPEGWEPICALSHMPPTGTERYALKRLLAQGGLGQVWLAYDRELQRDVALKQVLGKWNNTPKVVEQLRLEAIITGRLEHPGIVPVHDVGQDHNEQLFYCMKLVQGNTFREELWTWQKMPSGPAKDDQRRKIYSAFISICEAMGYAHSRGVLHLDLKPENVILGEYGETQILDWGLAKLLSSAYDSSSGRAMKGVVGTPRYMAPEQIAGAEESLSPTTDLFSLGVMLAEIALAEIGQELPSLEKGMLAEAPAQMREAIRHLRGPIRSICRKALAEAPAERYQEARLLSLDVQRLLAGDCVLVHREGPIAKFRRFTNKQRTFVAVVAVAFMILAGWWLEHRFDTWKARRGAEEAVVQAKQAWQQGDYSRAIDSLSNAADRLVRHSASSAETVRIQEDIRHLKQWREFDNALEQARLLSGDPKSNAKALDYVKKAATLADGVLPDPYCNENLRAQRASGLVELRMLRDWLTQPTKDLAKSGVLTSDAESASYLMGRALQLDGRPEEAAASFEKRLAENPQDFWAMYFLAVCHEEIGRPELALSEYTACLARQPQASFLHINRGNVYQTLKQKQPEFAEFALLEYKRAEQGGTAGMKPAYNRGVLLQESGKWEAALQAFEQARKLDPESIDLHVHIAKSLRMLGKVDDARSELESLRAKNPQSAATAAELAFVYWQAHEPAKAQLAADQATALDPKLSASPWIRGLIHADRQEWRQAAEAYRNAVNIEPNNPALRNNLADSLLALGKTTQAKSELEHALTLDADFVMARWNLIRAEIDMAQGAATLTSLQKIPPPVTNEEAFDQAQRYASTCLKAGQRLAPGAARPVVDLCIERIADLVDVRDGAFRNRLEQTTSIAALARNEETRKRLFATP